MKQNQFPRHPAPSVPGTRDTLVRMSAGIARCVRDFRHDYAPPFDIRCAAIGFGNAAYLATKYPEAAESLWAGFQGAGVPVDRAAWVEEYRGLTVAGEWITRTGEMLVAYWKRVVGDAPYDPAGLVLLSISTGLVIAQELPGVVEEMAAHWPALNWESQFLVTRLLAWADNDWQPQHEPFVEFALGFYDPGLRERAVMKESIAAVLPAALRHPDPWSVGVWADAGWEAGRRIVTEQPQTLRELVAEVPPRELGGLADLFWRTVPATAAGDGTVRPARAALRYFGVVGRDMYARTHCRGDQPRFVARAAFDFTLWMALLSGSPIPAPAR